MIGFKEIRKQLRAGWVEPSWRIAH